MVDQAKATKKQELLENIRRERFLLEQALSKFCQGEMLTPVFTSGWSAKDIVAHIIAWEQIMLKWIDYALRGEMPEDVPETDAEADAVNARIFGDNQNRDLVGILREFKSSHQEAIKRIEETPEEELNKPAKPPWKEERTLWWIISVNTWEHYREHREQLEKWMESKGK